MKTAIHILKLTTALAAAMTLSACGGSETPENDSATETAAPSSAPSSTSKAPQESAPPPAAQPAGLTVKDDTADEALETYIEGVKQGKLDVAIAVLVPDAPGTEKLYQMKEGWDRAAEAGAPIAMAQAALAGEIGALSYEKVSDDGAFATFQFSKPTSDKTWDIQAIKTPEGWRITPPPSGLPQG